jgi:hypothetical protein
MESQPAMPPKLRWYQYRLRSLLLVMLLVSIGMSGWLCVKRQRVPNALKSTTHLQFIDTPLSDVAAYLHDLHHIEIRIDRDALRAEGIEDPLVTQNLAGISLQSGLRLMLRDLDLTYLVRGNVLWITTPQQAAATGAGDSTVELDGRNEKRIAEALKQPTQVEFVDTPLSDVVDYLKDLHKVEIQFDYRALAGKVTQAQPWESPPITMNLKRLSLQSALRLMLRQQDMDYVIRDEVLLITTSRAATAMDQGRPDLRTPAMVAAEKRLAAALASPTQIEFVDTPLKDVVDYLKDLHHIEIQFDEKALKGVGIDESTPVTRDLRGVSLRSALSAILGDLGLDSEIRDEVLLIKPKNKDTR